jgi:hypothetical protein
VEHIPGAASPLNLVTGYWAVSGARNVRLPASVIDGVLNPTLAVPAVTGVILFCVVSPRLLAEPGALRATNESLASALQAEDLVRVLATVASARSLLGDKAGVPEVPDKFLPIDQNARWLTLREAQSGFVSHLAALEKLRWWRRGIDPTQISQALRVPASVLRGCVAVCRAGLDGAEQCSETARDAADFLIWAQEEAACGVYPFPAARRVNTDRAFQVAEHFLAEAERAGRLGDVVRKGWIFADLQNGGLQFDNAECGVAMLELYELTGEARIWSQPVGQPSGRWRSRWQRTGTTIALASIYWRKPRQ